MKTRSRRKRCSPISRIPDNLFYASAAKGYRPGGINGELSSLCGPNLASIGLSAGPGIYASDSLWSYELGAKNSFLDGRMQVNASAFVIDWNNIQQAVYLPGCGQNFVENLGKVRSVGGELEVQMRPVAGSPVGPFRRPRRCEIYAHGVRRSDRVHRSQSAGAAGRDGGRSTAGLRHGHFSPRRSTVFRPSRTDKPYLRIDYQYTTAQTALQPIQDPNNGVSDTTYTGLPVTRNLSLRAGLRWAGIDLSLFAQNLTDSHPVLSHTRRHERLGVVLRSYGPAPHHRDHGDLSPLTDLPDESRA